MHHKIVNGNWLSQADICKVSVFYITAVYENYKAGTHGRHRIILYEKAGIFTEADAKRARVIHHSLEEPTDAPALHKMRINNHIVYETEALCGFYLAFEKRLAAAALVDHVFGGRGGACGGSGVYEWFRKIFVEQGIVKSCAT